MRLLFVLFVCILSASGNETEVRSLTESMEEIIDNDVSSKDYESEGREAVNQVVNDTAEDGKPVARYGSDNFRLGPAPYESIKFWRTSEDSMNCQAYTAKMRMQSTGTSVKPNAAVRIHVNIVNAFLLLLSILF